MSIADCQFYPVYINALAFWQGHFKNKMVRENKYKIYTLGCKVNQYDSRTLAGKLKAAGFSLVKNDADLVIINTCAVTKIAIQKGRQMINRARKENPGARIIVTGCWPKVYEIDGLRDAEIVADEQRLESFVSKLKIKNSELKVTNQNLELLACHQTGSPGNGDRSRYFIKVQDGCEQFCSYCVIPYARGKLKSRDKDEVIAEINEAVKNGFREIILCGIHLGLYGKDSGSKKLEVRSEKPEIRKGEDQSNLVNLLRKVIRIENLGRVRLSSIEITEVNDRLIRLLSGNNKMCKHLHIPLQSGSDKILKLMNRPYGVKNYELRIKNIRKLMPDIAITTDIIVGFPGETEADFMGTYNFIKEIKFSRLHVFPFSAHEKTPAAKMPGAVSDEIKQRRVKKLKMLGEALSREYEKKFIGRELYVIVGGKKAGDKLIGKSEYYFDIAFDKSLIVKDKTGRKNREKEDDRDRGFTGRLVKVKFGKERMV